MAKRNGQMSVADAMAKHIGRICGKKERIAVSSRSIADHLYATDAKGWPIDDGVPSREAITTALRVLRDRGVLRSTGNVDRSGQGRPSIEYEYKRAAK